ncbi:uncharacterized protein MELLADRAFT_69661 [Melampsora larici-populina 98AG31]|uniref:Uncharacterized protein n=1 Tax=Melampsora larici-populina (strain 98AG31 / pathotype 3-4-7) TaxID=747676 RepID=F4SBN4_MELLP|nr:uncharacterized protein MELLADRAFT_69661 [Melampsora larici-populina 98AG31]EGF97930.1 hypothetical protein MELLADRAFT_69661 [Melampsora larici-populina 98AG31]
MTPSSLIIFKPSAQIVPAGGTPPLLPSENVASPYEIMHTPHIYQNQAEISNQSLNSQVILTSSKPKPLTSMEREEGSQEQNSIPNHDIPPEDFTTQTAQPKKKQKLASELESGDIVIEGSRKMRSDDNQKNKSLVKKVKVKNSTAWLMSLRKEGADQIRSIRSLWLEVSSFFSPWNQELEDPQQQDVSYQKRTASRMRSWITHAFLGLLKALHDQRSDLVLIPISGIQDQKEDGMILLDDLLLDGWKFLKGIFQEIKDKLNDNEEYCIITFKPRVKIFDLSSPDDLLYYLANKGKNTSLNLDKQALSNLLSTWNSSKSIGIRSKLDTENALDKIIFEFKEKPENSQKTLTTDDMKDALSFIRHSGKYWINEHMRVSVDRFFMNLKKTILSNLTNHQSQITQETQKYLSSAIYRAKNWLLSDFFGCLLMFQRDQNQVPEVQEAEMTRAWKFMQDIFKTWLKVDPTTIDVNIYGKLGYGTLYVDLLFFDSEEIFKHYFSLPPHSKYISSVHLWRILAQWYKLDLHKLSAEQMDHVVYTYKRNLLKVCGKHLEGFPDNPKISS